MIDNHLRAKAEAIKAAYGEAYIYRLPTRARSEPDGYWHFCLTTPPEEFDNKAEFVERV